MTIRHWLVSAGLLLLGLADPPATSAQTAADTTTLVRAMADRIGEDIRTRSAARLRHFYLGESMRALSGPGAVGGAGCIACGVGGR